MSYDLDTFTREAHAWPIPYMGFDHVRDFAEDGPSAYSQIPTDAAVRVYVGMPLSPEDAQHIRDKHLRVFLYLGDSEEEFNAPSRLEHRLLEAEYWIAANRLPWPVAASIAEEWAWRCQPGVSPVADWACFEGLDGMQRIALVREQMGELHGVLKARWPMVYSVGVEASWSSDTADGPGFGGWNPPWANLNVLGVTHYMGAGTGFGWNPHLTQAALDRFYADVGRRVEATKAYGKSTMMFAQAFSNELWPKVGMGQLDWWYVLAMKARVDALLFFAVQSVADVRGALEYPDLVGQIGSIWTHNQQQLT